MRGAGCTWNDIVDYKDRRQVARTRFRGRFFPPDISPGGICFCFAIQALRPGFWC